MKMILVTVTHGEYPMTEEFWIDEQYWDALFDSLNDLATRSMP